MAKEMNYEALQANLKMIDKKCELAYEQARANGTITPEKEKLSALMADQAFLERFFAVDSTEEAQALFKENGLELSKEEIDAFGRYIAHVSKKLIENGGELSEEELEQIAGGMDVDLSAAGALGGVLGMFGGFAAGTWGGVKLGAAIGNIICPGAGGVAGAFIGGFLGAAGGNVAGAGIGCLVGTGVNKLGKWIKSWF